MPRRFYTLDVFADRALAGNPLAVVLDADGLDTAAMQAIAREFNLSETVFVLPPDRPENRARLRIFTPGIEMPFAGHPTVGTSVLLATLDHPAGVADVVFGVEEIIGVIPCAVSLSATGAAFGRFSVPKMPSERELTVPAAAIATALGIEASEIGFGSHRPSVFGTGFPFTYVPVASRAVLGRIRLNTAVWAETFGNEGLGAAFVYCREPENPAHAFRARMFSPGDGIPEDPATGSAASALAGPICRFDRPSDGEHVFMIEQGFEMGRPSIIELTVSVRHGAPAHIQIGGHAVIVSQGELHV
ncbi:MAG: PhzF family phenazine biosynthesis protein [Labrys sp. (in: a-proteobacteria)]